MNFFRSLSFLKLISIIASIGLWYVVTTNVSTITITVPVEVRNLPEDILLISSSVSEVSVRVRGPSFLLNTGANSLNAIRVTVPKDVTNKYVVPIQSSDLTLPSGLSVAGIDPSEVELKFDKKATKIVPIEVPSLGRLIGQLQLDDISWEPKSVEVEGPLEILKELRQVETYPIDYRSLSSSTTKELAIRKPASSMTLSVDRVVATVNISPIQSKITLDRLPVEVRLVDGETKSINPRNVKVTISGAKNLVDKIDKSSIVPYVRLTDDDEPGSTILVYADVPKGMTLVSIEPTTLNVIGMETPMPKASLTPSPAKLTLNKGSSTLNNNNLKSIKKNK